MAGKIIGLVGPIAGGKSQASEALKEQGFVSFSLSTIVREFAGRQRGMRYADLMNPSNYADVSRHELQEASRLFRETHGGSILAEIVVRVIEQQRANGKLTSNADIVIEGIRGPEELQYLVDNLGMFPIGVTASQEERWMRVQSRVSETHREGEPTTWDEFRTQDRYELSKQGNDINTALELCRKYGYVIENTGHDAAYTRSEVLRIVGKSSTSEGQIGQKERIR